MASTPPALSTTSARLSGPAAANSSWTPWPAGAALGFPLGRPAELATASQLDLAWEAGGRRRGQPLSRYPVAPDCEIPNSVIRQLYDPADGETRVHFADGRRRRRSLTSIDTAERARQQQLAEAERDWLSAASLADLEAALESRRQMLEQLQRQAAEAEAAAAAAAGNSRASLSQAPSRAEEAANSTPTRQARQPRPINLRTLPPIAGPAVAEAADAEEAKFATRDATPAPAETPSAWLTAEDHSVEPLLQKKSEQQQQQQQQQQQKAAKKKNRKPIVKKTKKPDAAKGKAKSDQPAKDSTEAKQEDEGKKQQTEPQPQQQQQQQQQQPQSILKTVPSSAGSADRQQQQQPPPLPQVHLEQPIGRSPAASADRTRRVQFGDETSTAGSDERSGDAAIKNVGSDGRAAPVKLTLLEQILAEPWFTLADSPPPEKEPVARGLLRLMKFTVNAPDHAAMCDRMRDIKSQLDLELALLQDVVDELVAQLEAILQHSKEAAVLSLQRLRLMLAKGSATLRLLEFLGYSNADHLSQRWDSVHRQLELSLQEAEAAAEAAAVAAEAAAAAKIEADRASAAAAEAALASSAAGTSVAEDNMEDDETVRKLFEADLMKRLKRLRSETDDTEKADDEDDEETEKELTTAQEPAVSIGVITAIGEVEGDEKEPKAWTASSTKEAAAPKRPKRAASFADSGLGSSEITSLTATDHHATPGRAHTMISFGDSRETTMHNKHQLPPPQPPQLTVLGEEQQRSDSSGSGEAARTSSVVGDGGGASRGGSSSSGLRARPITASVRTGNSGASGRGDVRIDSGTSSAGRQSQLQELPDILLIDSRLDKPVQPDGRQPLLSQHSGLYDLLDDHRIRKLLMNLPKIQQVDTDSLSRRARRIVYGPSAGLQADRKEFIPGRDNVICSAGSSSRSPALLLAIDQRYSSSAATAVPLAFNADQEAKPAKRRVTILTPTAAAAMEAADPGRPNATRCQPFSFMTRSRTEPKFAASSAGGRPSYIGSRDWAKLSGVASADDGLLPALGNGGAERHRLAWPDHCRMDNLARRGMHRTGVSISKHLDRYTLIDTVGRGLRVSMQKQAELSLARSSTSLQNLSAF